MFDWYLYTSTRVLFRHITYGILMFYFKSTWIYIPTKTHRVAKNWTADTMHVLNSFIFITVSRRSFRLASSFTSITTVCICMY